MVLSLSFIFVFCTIAIYLVIAFIQFRRVWLMRGRVKFLSEKGKRVSGKIISYGRPNYVEIEFVNHSNSRVITEFRIRGNQAKLPVGSEVTVLLGGEPNNTPAIVLEYNKKPVSPNIFKYSVFGIMLAIIALFLSTVLFSVTSEFITQYTGVLIPFVAGLAIFIAVTEDEMMENRLRNLLLLHGLNATARIRKANSTGSVKNGYKQISFFLAFLDHNGKARFGKAEEHLDIKNYDYFKKERKVDILYVPGSNKRRCLLNYTWK